MRSLRAVAVAVPVVLLLGGLVSPAPAQAATEAGQCYSYKAAVLKELSTTAPAVDCTAQHTAETYFVRTLTDGFGVPSEASQGKRLAAGAPCTVAAMNAYLGMPDRKLPSRFRTIVLFPTDDQWASGERWMRCDVVLQGGLQLKVFAGTAAALVAATPQTQFDFCTPGEPNAKATAAYPCLNPKKNWIKVLDKELGGPGSTFPGTGTVESKTRRLCGKQGKKWNGGEKYPGWWAIWPTSIGWKQGKRSAQCFVPYKQYLKEVAAPAPKPTPTPTPTPTPVPVPVPEPTATVDPQPPTI
jgi:hypothetical protein